MNICARSVTFVVRLGSGLGCACRCGGQGSLRNTDIQANSSGSCWAWHPLTVPSHPVMRRQDDSPFPGHGKHGFPAQRCFRRCHDAGSEEQRAAGLHVYASRGRILQLLPDIGGTRGRVHYERNSITGGGPATTRYAFGDCSASACAYRKAIFCFCKNK